MIEKSVKKLLIKTKRQVFSEIAGNNPSLFKGEGFDFVELREYMPGDDVKKIDWLISAKLQKPYVKVFKEERELNIVTALMLNGSTYFGTKRFKYELMAQIGAILGFSAIKNQDNFSYLLYADKEYGAIRPTKNINAVTKFTEAVMRFEPLGKRADFEGLIQRLFKLRRRSIIFIISDFLEEVNLKVLAKKHEVVAIIVRDRFEEEPVELGFVNVLDPQSRESLLVDLDGATIKNYKKEILRQDRVLYKDLKSAGVRFTKIYTHEDPFVKLLKLFGQR